MRSAGTRGKCHFLWGSIPWDIAKRNLDCTPTGADSPLLDSLSRRTFFARYFTNALDRVKTRSITARRGIEGMKAKGTGEEEGRKL